MRIFCAVRHSNDPRFFYGGLWSGNFYPALRQLGHEIVESQVDLFPTSCFMSVADRFTGEELDVRAQTTGRILEEVRTALRQGPLDLFLSYFYNAHFDPAGFDELRRLGVLSVNFYCNSIYQFAYVAAIAANVNFAWHTERDAGALYLAVGANPIWVQMGADPEIYRPMASVARQPKACFVGQRYADRDRWMAALIRACVPVDIYGPGWGGSSSTDASSALPTGQQDAYLGRKLYRPGSLASYRKALWDTVVCEGLVSGLGRIARQWSYRYKTRQLSSRFAQHAMGAVPFQNIASILASYEIYLNFSNVWADGRPGSCLIPHVRLRDFEGPMCQTCYLTGHTDEIMEFYEVGKEIDTYRSPAELVDKARFYLSHPGVAAELRQAGYHRALRDHTWKRRFEKLFAEVGL